MTGLVRVPEWWGVVATVRACGHVIRVDEIRDLELPKETPVTCPAVEKYGADAVHTFTYDLAGNGKSQILKTAGAVKLVAEKDGPVLGVHMVGSRVGELLGEAQLIYNWEALPSEVAALLPAHPSQSEAVGEAHLAVDAAADRMMRIIAALGC